MTWFRVGGGSGIQATLKNRMNAVLNKKFGTAVDYAPETWPDEVNLMGMLEEKTQASASVCSFDDGADDVPIKSLVANLPASLDGYSEVDVIHAGKNLAVFDDRTYSVGGVTFTCNNQVVTVSNTSTTTYPQAIIAQNLLFKKGTYTASITVENEPSGGYLYIILQKGGSNYVSTKNGSSTFTLTEDSQLNFLAVAEGNGITWNDATLKFQIEAGSTATTYEPYTAPTTHTAQLGRTIHGGEVDIVNGEGKETWAIIDMGDLTWTYDSTYNRFISSSLPDCIKIDTARTTPILCSAYQVISDGRPLSQVPDKSIYLSFHSSGSSLTDAFVHDSDYTDATAFKTAVTGQKIVYQLKDSAQTPFTFTGQEVPTRLGYNAFWSDEGDTEVTYRASGTVYQYPEGEEASF